VCVTNLSADSKQKNKEEGKIKTDLFAKTCEKQVHVHICRERVMHVVVQPNVSHSLEKREHGRSCKEKQEHRGS
jgi:hypothetical protein